MVAIPAKKKNMKKGMKRKKDGLPWAASTCPPTPRVNSHVRATVFHFTFFMESERRSPIVPVCPTNQHIRIRKKRHFSRSGGP